VFVGLLTSSGSRAVARQSRPRVGVGLALSLQREALPDRDDARHRPGAGARARVGMVGGTAAADVGWARVVRRIRRRRSARRLDAADAAAALARPGVRRPRAGPASPPRAGARGIFMAARS